MNKETKKKELRNYSIDFGVCIFCGNCVEYCPTNCLSMTEEYELSAFDRHSLNFDNVALGRLPTSVTTDPSVKPLRELGYLPEKVMDPHEIPSNQPRAGQLPSEILEFLKQDSDLSKQVESTNDDSKATQDKG